MTNPIPGTGEAIPNSLEPTTEENRDSQILILDAQNILCEIKSLNQAIFLAAHGLGQREHIDAIATVADIIWRKLKEADEILDAARAAQEASR
ncbi:hypothetical protein ACK83U_12560 [Rhizobium sp. WW22]|uniref:hypothetical protein n=1 Tax=Rhizobium sp. WW22 TaxID=3389070 RepID=UPI000DD9014E